MQLYQPAMQHLPLLTAGWSYIPAGLSFGYLLLLPVPSNENLSDMSQATTFWPYVVAVIMLIVATVLTNGLKLISGKCQFVHLYVQLAAMVFFLAAGFIFLLVEDVVPAIYLASCGLGLTLTPGLTYIHIRAPGRWRSVYMGLCYFWFLVGVGATATIFLSDPSIWQVATVVHRTIHTNLAACLLASANFIVVLLAVIEMLHREGIVDYKKPLDADTDTAHESGKLFGRRKSRVTLTNSEVGSRQGNLSTEQIVADEASGGGGFYKLWVFLMIFTKLQSFISFYWVFIRLAIVESISMFGDESAGYALFWFMTLGCLIGVFLMFFINNKIIYLVTSVLHTVGLILVVTFYYTNGYDKLGSSYIVFYTFIGASLAIPSINILELSPLKFNEAFLAAGFVMELIGIALVQHFALKDVSMYGLYPETEPEAEQSLIYEVQNNNVLGAHFIATILLSVILQVIVLWHMPNTFGKTLAEINSDLARMTSYFAFRRKMAPINRVFSESISSEQLEIEDKQLSTRRGQPSYGLGDRSIDSVEGSSPHNALPVSRYQRQSAVEREFSSTPERDDPYLQEQLQWLHERNYILSRQQQLYQQQVRHSLEPQQYNYRNSERASDNLQHHQRYNSEFDNHSQDRQRNNGDSQKIQNQYTMGLPLLSRQQYYEQYNQEPRHRY